MPIFEFLRPEHQDLIQQRARHERARLEEEAISLHGDPLPSAIKGSITRGVSNFRKFETRVLSLVEARDLNEAEARQMILDRDRKDAEVREAQRRKLTQSPYDPVGKQAFGGVTPKNRPTRIDP